MPDDDDDEFSVIFFTLYLSNSFHSFLLLRTFSSIFPSFSCFSLLFFVLLLLLLNSTSVLPPFTCSHPHSLSVSTFLPLTPNSAISTSLSSPHLLLSHYPRYARQNYILESKKFDQTTRVS